jgi:hypothetical protein
MAKVPKHLGKGFSNVHEIGKIIHDMADDIVALKTALEAHTHSATATATTTVVTLKTTREK